MFYRFIERQIATFADVFIRQRLSQNPHFQEFAASTHAHVQKATEKAQLLKDRGYDKLDQISASDAADKLRESTYAMRVRAQQAAAELEAKAQPVTTFLRVFEQKLKQYTEEEAKKYK